MCISRPAPGGGVGGGGGGGGSNVSWVFVSAHIDHQSLDLMLIHNTLYDLMGVYPRLAQQRCHCMPLSE